MTKDKFRSLCEQVLFPRLSDVIHRRLAEMFETQDAMARELARVGDGLDRIVAQLERLDDNADRGR